jgi:hypothetical protein
VAPATPPAGTTPDLHGWGQQHDRQPAAAARLAALNREHDVLLYLDDAHGFGVVGERAADEVTELLAALDRLVDVVPLRAA